MILRLPFVYILCASTLAALASLHTLVQAYRLRRINHAERRLARCYVRITTTLLLEDEEPGSHFPLIEQGSSKELLARILADISTATYGSDSAKIWNIASENGIDRWLLRRISRSRAYERAYYFSLLAALPDIRVERYAKDKNPLVRFYTLLIRIRCDSSSALRHLAEYDRKLTRVEVTEIITLLRRGVLPIACDPLLRSTNRNLRFVGLSIVREFGIEEAAMHLLRIATCDSDAELSTQALYAMVEVHSSFANRDICERIRTLPYAERYSLCRRLARAGYSTSTLRHLLSTTEAEYAERLSATYKRTIICQQIS